MHTKESVEAFAKQFGYTSQWGAIGAKGALSNLHSLLQPDEALKGIIGGNLNSNGAAGTGCILVATNKRAIIYRKGLLGTGSKEEIPLQKITSATYVKGLLKAAIELTVSGNTMQIHWVDKKNAEKMVAVLSNLISTQNETMTNVNNSSVADELKKLSDLKDAGILSDSEFEQQKQKILARS